MKKFFSLFIGIMWASVLVAANCVSVKQIATDYKNNKVTVDITWSAGCTGDASNHRNTVWVFVDYRTITGGVKSSIWNRAIVSATSAGTVVDSGTSKGILVYGASSTTQRVTLTLSSMPTQYDWCAFATDYPPNVTADGGAYAFKGTPPFILTAADGITKQIVSGKTLAIAALTIAPKTLTDATGCPGTFCPYTGGDLLIDVSHACRLRTSGAKNWEAWIKDTRDNELYRIVLMPDNKWWLAQNVKLASYNSITVGAIVNGCSKDECGRRYSSCSEVFGAYGGTSGSSGNVQGICPGGWLLPVRGTFGTMVGAIGSSAGAALRCYNSSCSPISDTYGWASLFGTENGVVYPNYSLWYTNDAGREDGFTIDGDGGGYPSCNLWSISNDGECQWALVRCYRAL